LPTTKPEEIPAEDLLSMAKSPREKKKEGKFAILFGRSPYPDWIWPTPEACEEVHTLLAQLHGEAKAPTKMPPPSLTVAGCGEVPSVLDALLRTVLSASTTMTSANQSIAALAEKYGVAESGLGKGSIDWKKVSHAPAEEVAIVIGKGGLGNLKAKHMKGILDTVMQKQKKLSLDHLHGQTAEVAMKELGSLPGVGVKTAACVILFCLQIPCFAVDTHVFRLCKWLRWVPSNANEDKTFWHCDFHMPAQLKYGLHQLLIRHGQSCDRCRADTFAGTDSYNNTECPLEHLVLRNKKEAKPPTPKPEKKRREKKGKKTEGDEEGVKEDADSLDTLVESSDNNQAASGVAMEEAMQLDTGASRSEIKNQAEDGKDITTY
jgi:endonuclease III